MVRVNPYLNFNGNTEAAFNLYKSVFGGEFAMLQRFKDIPSDPNSEPMSESDLEKIMHIALPIGPDYVLMATDALESQGHTLVNGNNISLSISVDNKEEADQIFNGLAAGGEVEMPMTDTFWGAYFGMLTDAFGIKWMVNYDYPKQ